MSDRYVNVKIQVEDMKSLGEAEDDADKEGVDAEERVPGCSPTASVSPDPATVTRAGRDATNTSILCKQRVKSRSKLGKDAKNSCGKRTSDMAMHGSVVAAHVGTNLNRLGHERTLHVRGTGKILQGKLETNGNYANTHPSKNNQEDGKRKRRPVTVDISKAKTSLEALKLSITQLKWKEVFIPRCTACSREDVSCINSIGMTTSLAFGHQCDDNLCRTMCHCNRSHRV